MLIRPEQMQALSNARTGAFESDVLSHLQRCFPAECAALGEPGVRDTIRYGLERSRGYGLTAAREVCTYVDLMMAFGRDFDRDPKLPWAADILNRKRWKDTATMVDQLYRTAQQHYRERRIQS
jgi:hypothetical protein